MPHLSIQDCLQIIMSSEIPEKHKQHILSCSACTDKITKLQILLQNNHDPDQICPDFDESKMALYFDKKLSKQEEQQFEQHLLSCPYCFSVYSDLTLQYPIMKKIKKNKPLKISLLKQSLEIKNNFFFPFPELTYSPAVRGRQEKKIIKMTFKKLLQNQTFFISIAHKSKKKFDFEISAAHLLQDYTVSLYKKKSLILKDIISDHNPQIFWTDLEPALYVLFLNDRILWKGQVQ